MVGVAVFSGGVAEGVKGLFGSQGCACK